jgi:glycosyltransferase involved in cell wall biosynthesis
VRRTIRSKLVSIVIPTFNGAARIGNCLNALMSQTAGVDAEILVVDDGSTDNIKEVIAGYEAGCGGNIRLIQQRNAGPAAARNRGALEAKAPIIVFTDDDCVPMPGWLTAMLVPFSDPEIVGVKGIYCTLQPSLVARFVQREYEEKYRRMARYRYIDFIDTYSAAYRRDRFLEMNGFDTSFPVACAEDVELSYRMSARGWKMKLVPEAVVAHTHPATLTSYLKKKYKFAFWRVLAVSKNPRKGLKDSHTPQLMKLQLLFAPLLLVGATFDLVARPSAPASLFVLAVFLVSTLPFMLRAMWKDPVLGLLSPILLALRACAQGLGVVEGLIYARRNQSEVPPAKVNEMSPNVYLSRSEPSQSSISRFMSKGR